MINRTELAQNYINLLKKSLNNELYIENEARIVYTIEQLANKQQIELGCLYKISERTDFIHKLNKIKEVGDNIVLQKYDSDGLITGIISARNYTELSHTMIGMKRLNNIQYCMETVLEEGVPGDFIETGIWRGGATIFMRGVLKAYGIEDRLVWAADSFEGVPPPTHSKDVGLDISAVSGGLPILSVSLEDVIELFDRYDLLDDKVNFIQGWFKDTLTKVPIEKLAVLRLDGDLYESTMDALNPLYYKVSPGGFIIVDDYFSCLPCKLAIDEFRLSHNVDDKIITIDSQSVFWRKST